MPGVRFEDARPPDGMRLYAIGDVHGSIACLNDLLATIEGEIARDRPQDWRIVYLGDYVDRGPDSAGVIEAIATRRAADPRHVALMGNHDEVFAAFLSDPSSWQQFEMFEGGSTARSYGVELDFRDRHAILPGHRALCEAVPAAHQAFLAELRYSVIFGDFFFCHAGIRPGVPLDRQDPHDLTWIRREFHHHAGLYDKVIVHGHTPHDEPEVFPNRVNLDTCAFATGRLTALAVDGERKRFLEGRA